MLGRLAEPGIPEVFLDPARRDDGEHAYQVGLESVGVRHAARQEDERSGAGRVGLLTYVEGDVAFEDVEALVVMVVEVARGLKTYRRHHLHETELPAGVFRTGQDAKGSPCIKRRTPD